MRLFGWCYASAFKHLSGEYFLLAVDYSVLVQILLNDSNLKFLRLRTSSLMSVVNEASLITHLGRLFTISTAKETTTFNNRRAARLSAFELFPSKPRNLGSSSSSEAGSNAKASSGTVDLLTFVPIMMEWLVSGTYAKVEHRRLGHPPIPRLKPQPFPSSLNLQPSSVVCFRWIIEGCKGTFCSVASCFRSHKFHGDQSAADIQAYKDLVLTYVKF